MTEGNTRSGETVCRYAVNGVFDGATCEFKKRAHQSERQVVALERV